MKVRSVTKYTVTQMWSLFNILFAIDEIIYISSSYRTNGSLVDWVHCFDADHTHLGDMNQDYFWKLKSESYIKEFKP